MRALGVSNNICKYRCVRNVTTLQYTPDQRLYYGLRRQFSGTKESSISNIFRRETIGGVLARSVSMEPAPKYHIFNVSVYMDGVHNIITLHRATLPLVPHEKWKRANKRERIEESTSNNVAASQGKIVIAACRRDGQQTTYVNKG